jgi:hypothetical protein
METIRLIQENILISNLTVKMQHKTTDLPIDKMNPLGTGSNIDYK